MRGRRVRLAAGLIACLGLVPGTALAGAPPAAAATTSWRSVPYPAGTGFLNGLSCASPRFCMAVGGTDTTPEAPLTERWNGSHWSIVPSPVPAGTVSSALGGDVSCSSERFCMAIGNASTADGTEQALTETWDGRRWSIGSSLSSSFFPGVEEVSCASARFCAVVGGFSRGTVAVWDGRAWSYTPTAPVLPPGEESDLWHVSCAGTRFCMATGFSIFPDGTVRTNYTVWDGRSWSSTPNAAIDFGMYDNLTGVSCTTHRFCATTGGPTQTYSATRAPQWKPTPEQNVVSGDISCTSERSCVASDGTLAGGVQAWDGHDWTHVPNTSGFFFQVSCAGRSFCAAIAFGPGFTPSFQMRAGRHDRDDN